MDRHITVSGHGESAADPDQCTIDMRVGASAPTVSEATSTMGTATRRVIDALTAAGAAEVATSRFSIRTEHDNQGRPSGFRSETSLRVTTPLAGGSGDAASRLLGEAVKAGGDHLVLDGVDFAHSDPTELEHQASRAALADARAKAGAMAEAAGTTLGEVQVIDQQNLHTPGPVRFKAMAAVADMPVQPGTTTVAVDVRVTFALQ